MLCNANSSNLAHKEVQVLLMETKNPIQYYSFISTQLNASKY